ncbi:MAG: M56 family metallopeptidase [Tepidisphaeraceae bacterium]
MPDGLGSDPVKTLEDQAEGLPADTYRDPLGGIRRIPLGPITSSDRAAVVIEPYLPYVVNLWLGGMVCMAAFQIFGLIGLRRLAGEAKPVSDKFTRQFQTLASNLKIGRRVRFLEIGKAMSPLTFGWTRPAVVIPVSLLTTLTPIELNAIVSHELAHIRRHDFFVLQAQAVLESFFFFNPFVWMLSSEINHDREMCCDNIAARAIGDFKFYASLLAKLSWKPADSLSVPALGFTGHSILGRIRAMRLFQRAPAKNVSSVFVTVLSCGICVSVLTGSAIASAMVRVERRKQSYVQELDVIVNATGIPDSRRH